MGILETPINLRYDVLYTDSISGVFCAIDTEFVFWPVSLDMVLNEVLLQEVY